MLFRKFPLVLFLLLAGLPLAGLVWLARDLFSAEYAVQQKEVAERLENAASLLAREVDRNLTRWEETAGAAARDRRLTLPDGATLLVLDAAGVREQYGVPLLYYPVTAAPSHNASAAMTEAEAFELAGEIPAAIRAYRTIASTMTDERARALALVRLAAHLRRTGQKDEALRSYAELVRLGNVPAPSDPAVLVGYSKRAEILAASGNQAAQLQEEASLVNALLEPSLRIDRATFDLYFQNKRLRPDIEPRRVLTEAADELWPMWRERPRGRAASTHKGVAFATVWRPTASGTAILLGTVSTLMEPSEAVLRELNVQAALQDPSPKRVWGEVTFPQPVSRAMSQSGLPWTILVAPADPAELQTWISRRQKYLSAGIGLIAIVVVACAYLAYRAVIREMAVARLQADFVAAVSHEFRTPLTAMRHITDLLEDGRAVADRMPRYVEALGTETRRLQATVERLLDFGRLERARHEYQLESIDAGTLTQKVIEEFANRAHAPRRIDWHGPDDAVLIRADRAAFALALRNLLDNAVKYSPEGSIITVSVARRGDDAGIAVADHGIGITPREQRLVFQKFVRGEAARSLNVKGTGIGLALVHSIVKAHGGRIELQSKEREGSTFTILVPLAEA